MRNRMNQVAVEGRCQGYTTVQCQYFEFANEAASNGNECDIDGD